MANLYRPTFTVLDVQTGGRSKRQAKVWWAQYRDFDGTLRRVSLKTRKKSIAHLKLADLVRAVDGGVDYNAGARQRARPLAEHLADWHEAGKARGVTPEQLRLRLFRVLRVVDALDWRRLSDLNTDAAEGVLAGLMGTKRGRWGQGQISAKTRNDYADTLRSFGIWLVKTKRLADNPFEDLHRISIAVDRRHDRRPLSGDEMAKLIDTALVSKKVYRNLKGRDRAMLYLLAVSTGFRAGELASLTPTLFKLDDVPPHVQLAAKDDKARRAVRQPLPASIVPDLREYLSKRKPDAIIWPGKWVRWAAEIIQHDLLAAGIPYAIQGPDGPLFADFHSLRHSFIARLDSPGVTLKQAMTLARHSDPRLTMKTYGQAQMQDLAATVNAACGTLVLPKPPDDTPAPRRLRADRAGRRLAGAFRRRANGQHEVAFPSSK